MFIILERGVRKTVFKENMNKKAFTDSQLSDADEFGHSFHCSCVCVGSNAVQVFLPFSVSCHVGFRLLLLGAAETHLTLSEPEDNFSLYPL